MTHPTRATDLVQGDLGAKSAAHQRAAARLGQVLGRRYELVGVLGTGATSSVYRALDQRESGLVAVKLLHEKLKQSERDRLRFERELRAASAIHHPNVVRLLDHGFEPDGTPYQVLELLVGRQLDGLLEGGGLDLSTSVDVALQLLAALSAAHLRGYVHRDVKPENIFLTENEAGLLHVKLIDFGTTRTVHQDPDIPSITGDNVSMGLPYFTSPEQISSDYPLSPATDVWQAGAVLFTMIAGHPPFFDENLTWLLVRIAREAAPSLATFRPECPVAISAVVSRALQRHPAHRFPDAGAMSGALLEAAYDAGLLTLNRS